MAIYLHKPKSLGEGARRIVKAIGADKMEASLQSSGILDGVAYRCYENGVIFKSKSDLFIASNPNGEVVGGKFYVKNKAFGVIGKLFNAKGFVKSWIFAENGNKKKKGHYKVTEDVFYAMQHACEDVFQLKSNAVKKVKY